MEVQLGHAKEARWMFNEALEALPLHIQLWKDVSFCIAVSVHIAISRWSLYIPLSKFAGSSLSNTVLNLKVKILLYS